MPATALEPESFGYVTPMLAVVDGPHLPQQHRAEMAAGSKLPVLELYLKLTSMSKTYRVGRYREMNLDLWGDPAVSRYHLQVRYLDKRDGIVPGFYFTALKLPRNGRPNTFLRDGDSWVPCDPKRWYHLDPGDELRLGTSTVLLYSEEKLPPDTFPLYSTAKERDAFRAARRSTGRRDAESVIGIPREAVDPTVYEEGPDED